MHLTVAQGSHMAANLVKSGRQVIAFDVNSSNLSRAESAGAKRATSPGEVAAAATKIITMLPQSSHVQDVYLKDNGVLSKARKGSLLIDCRYHPRASSLYSSNIQASREIPCSKQIKFLLSTMFCLQPA